MDELKTKLATDRCGTHARQQSTQKCSIDCLKNCIEWMKKKTRNKIFRTTTWNARLDRRDGGKQRKSAQWITQKYRQKTQDRPECQRPARCKTSVSPRRASSPSLPDRRNGQTCHTPGTIPYGSTEVEGHKRKHDSSSNFRYRTTASCPREARDQNQNEPAVRVRRVLLMVVSSCIGVPKKTCWVHSSLPAHICVRGERHLSARSFPIGQHSGATDF